MSGAASARGDIGVRVLFLACLAVVALLVIPPVATLLWQSFSGPQGPGPVASFDAYRKVLGTASTYTLLLNTVTFSATMTVVAGTMGFLFAWVAARTNAPLSALMPIAILLPYLIPPMLGAVCWILLLSPSNGIINMLLEPLVGPRFFNIYSFAGMVFVETLYAFPIAFMFFYAALVTIDPAQEEAASVAGAPAWRILLDTTIPTVLPAILSVATLLFIIGFESFDVAWFLGYPAKIYILSVEIFLLTSYDYPPDIAAASVYGAIALVASFVLVAAYRRMTREPERFSTVSGKAYRTGTIDLGWLRYPASALFFGLIGIIGVIPILLLLAISLEMVRWPFAIAGHPGLANFAWILTQPESQDAILHTAELAIAGAFVVVTGSFLISYITTRTNLRGRGLLDYLAFLPFGFPGTVLAVGLITLLISTPLYNTIWIMLLAFTVKFLPFGLRNVTSGMLQIGRELEEASVTSGGSLATTLRRVILPLAMPSMISAWSLLFIIYGRQFSLPLMLSSPGSQLITIVLFQEWDSGAIGHVAAFGVFMVLASLPFLILARWTRSGSMAVE